MQEPSGEPISENVAIKIPPPIRKSFILIGQKTCLAGELIFQARRVWLGE